MRRFWDHITREGMTGKNISSPQWRSNSTMNQWRLMLKSRRLKTMWMLVVSIGGTWTSFLFHSSFIAFCACKARILMLKKKWMWRSHHPHISIQLLGGQE